MDLVVTSLEAWDTVWRRNQHLVAGLLRCDPALRVLFVEPATDPLHAGLGGGRPRRGRGLRAHVSDGIRDGGLWLLEPTKWLPRRVDRSVDERWARQVVRAARGLGMSDPVLWVNDPRGAMLVEATTWRSLYDVTDDWTLAERPAAETARIRAQEHVLLSRCDEVVVCSPALAASKGEHRDVTLIPNGVDVSAYSVAHARPGGLPDPPVVLYAGTLHGDRLDVALCARVAHALEGHGRLVLLGPNALETAERATLQDAGVVLLGARPSAEVPAYLMHADVLVVPHVVTPFTDSLDPIKLYEYQAAGRPVVSTPVAGFRDTVDELVTIADADTFAAVVGGMVDGVGVRAHGTLRRPDAERLALIDWSTRVDGMAAIVTRLRAGGST
jgi:glycosyltransferase involved in cell wall biosynthesis